MARKMTLRCQHCELVTVNGVICHEHGCPNVGARWDVTDQLWILQRACKECGCWVDKSEPCCDSPPAEDPEWPPDDGRD